MASCVFPEDIMLCILTRLPVKSIIRFKSVSKPWRDLLSTPQFMKMHHSQFSSDPKNQSLVVHSINSRRISYNTMFFLNIESNEKEPAIINHPFRDVVGCCNGLFCILSGQEIVLWNPAMNLSKIVSSPSIMDCGVRLTVSLGFGYDAEADDFKVVRIVRLKNQRDWEKMTVNEVEVYSANSDSWTTIDTGFQFCVFPIETRAIVNGNPYWVVVVGKNTETNHFGEVLVCFDVRKLAFHTVPLSSLILEDKPQFVDWNGSSAALVRSKKNDSRGEYVDVWVFDDGEQVWIKNHTFGPMEMNVDWILHCSENGKVLVSHPDSKIFVFDPETGCVEELFCGPWWYETYEYTESLSYIKGMKTVVGEKEDYVDSASSKKLQMF